MPDHYEEIKVELINNKVQFTATSVANPDHPITMDYKPPLGDGQGYNGLELFLTSLAGCSATAMTYLLRNSGKTLVGLHVHARGMKTKKPPLKYETITLCFHVQSPDMTSSDLDTAIKQAEAGLCPVWQMIKNNVEVNCEYEITVP